VKAPPIERRPGECVDCYVAAQRPVVARPTDGAPRVPRCATHKRAHLKLKRAKAHATRVKRVYGISPEFQAMIWEFQGERCPCGRRPTRFPDTDHDHVLARDHDHPDNQGCEECVRGMCCRACNTYVLGRYSAAQLRALADYLDNPPAQQLLVSLDEVPA